ncbi:MAG: hypothetical protein ACYSU0_00415, partial [Planctomycetota bacterium]
MSEMPTDGTRKRRSLRFKHWCAVVGSALGTELVLLIIFLALVSANPWNIILVWPTHPFLVVTPIALGKRPLALAAAGVLNIPLLAL